MKLLALRCPECEQPLTPATDDIVVLCQQCHTPVSIGDNGLSRITVHYAEPAVGAVVTHWQPFWIFDGRVHILKRKTQGGSSREREAQHMWSQPRRFYVPAWELSMRTAQDLGSHMVERQPRYQPIGQPSNVQLTPVVLTAEDAAKLLEFIVLAIEARRSDWLKDFQFKLDLESPELWVLPADETGLVAREGD